MKPASLAIYAPLCTVLHHGASLTKAKFMHRVHRVSIDTVHGGALDVEIHGFH